MSHAWNACGFHDPRGFKSHILRKHQPVFSTENAGCFCFLGFGCAAVAVAAVVSAHIFAHVIRLLELENAKTAGCDFRAEMPSLGFRVLEFEKADTSRQVRTNLTPQRSPTTHIL